MNLIDVFECFLTKKESCIEHLERIRLRGNPACLHYESKSSQERRRCGACRMLVLP